MTPYDAGRFAELLAGLGEVFNEPVSEIRARLYFEALKNMPLDAIEGAVGQLIQSARFFPKPAEILAHLEGSVEDRAREAWRRVLGALEHVGTYDSVDFGDPILHAVVEAMGGWHEAWAWDRAEGPELLGLERDFVSLYRLYSERGVDRPPPAVLLGQHALHNRQLGLMPLRGALPPETVVVVEWAGGGRVKTACREGLRASPRRDRAAVKGQASLGDPPPLQSPLATPAWESVYE